MCKKITADPQHAGKEDQEDREEVYLIVTLTKAAYIR